MKRKILNQNEMYYLIKETVEKKIEEQKLKEATAAFRREVLQNLAEEMMGEETDVSQIEEGMMSNLWDKAKGLIGGSSKQQASFTRAIEKATNKQTQQFLNDLEDVAPGFPNTKGKAEVNGKTVDKFVLGLSLIQTTYSLLAKQAATAKSKAERMTAAAAANDIVAYANDAVGDVSRTFKYFKEADETEVIEEAVSLKFLDRFFDAATTQVQGGAEVPTRMLKRAMRMSNKLEKEIANKGLENLGPRERRAWEEMQEFRDKLDQWNAQELEVDAEIADIIDGPVDAGSSSASAATAVPDDLDDGGVQYPSQDPADYEGWPGEPEIDPEWTPDATPGLDAGVGIDVPDVPGAGEAAAAAAEGGSDMINVLGVPIASKLAVGLGLGVGAAVIGVTMWKTYKYLKKKQAAGDSREGMLSNIAKTLKPVQPNLNTAPETVPGEKATQTPTADAQQGAAPAGGKQQAPSSTGANARVGKQTPGSWAAQGQGTPTPTPANTGGMQPGAVDLDSDPMKQPRRSATPEPPEEDEEEKKAREDYYASLQEVKRWQKIAGISK